MHASIIGTQNIEYENNMLLDASNVNAEPLYMCGDKTLMHIASHWGLLWLFFLEEHMPPCTGRAQLSAVASYMTALQKRNNEEISTHKDCHFPALYMYGFCIGYVWENVNFEKNISIYSYILGYSKAVVTLKFKISLSLWNTVIQLITSNQTLGNTGNCSLISMDSCGGALHSYRMCGCIVIM